MSEAVKEYLDSKGWEYDTETNNFVVHRCPCCLDEGKHFNIHVELGLWRCVKCNESGNLHILKKRMGDLADIAQASPTINHERIDPTRVGALHQSLMSNPAALAYVHSRGLTVETIQRFCLGLDFDGMGYWLAIPYAKGGEWWDIKYRTLPPQPKAFRKEPNCETPLFNEDAIVKERKVIICEGEIDLMTLWQLGYRNAVSVPLGAGTFKPEHWDVLCDKEVLYLIFDTDSAGRKGAREVAERIDPARCRKVVLPGVKDVNEFYANGGTKEQLDHLLAEAEPYGKPHTYTAAQALIDLGNQLEESGVVAAGPAYPWPVIQQLLGGMGFGEITAVQGAPGVGKTTWCMQVLISAALQQRVPSMMFCLELPIYRQAQLLTGQLTMCDRRTMTRTHVVEALARIYNAPLYLAGRPKNLDWNTVRDTLVMASRRFGIRLFCFDNIQFLARSEEMTQQVGIISRNLKLLVEELNCHGLIVVHPRKHDQTTVAGQYDAAWSQAIAADADTQLTIWRKLLQDPNRRVSDADFATSEKTYDTRTIVRAVKSRYGAGGQGVLFLHDPSGVFLPEDPNGGNAQQQTQT